MSELNNTNPQVNNGQQVVNPAPQPVQTQPEQGQVQMVMVQQPQKEGLWDKIKRHKAAVVTTIVGIGTAVASAVVAYTKGKQAGAMQQQMPPMDPYGDDNSLNPNI